MTLLVSVAAMIPADAKSPETLTFALGADFHAQDMPMGEDYLTAFINAAKDANADFIVELGDFCRLDSASRKYHNIWNSFNGPKYHVIGNHDMDSYNAKDYVAGMGMPGRYYSFDHGNFHFIVLDGNNLHDGKNYTHYQYANFYVDGRMRAFMDPEQMEWLKRDIDATDKKCVLFSHQSVDTHMRNGSLVRQILEEANRKAGFKKVVLAFSGHDHSNYTKVINGIIYMQINSATYQWVDVPTKTEQRYSKEVNEKFPMLKYCVTYDKPLFAIVTLTDNGAVVKGREASFVPPTPVELGLPDSISEMPLVPFIKDADIKF